MKKRTTAPLAVAMSVAMSLTLCACGGGAEETESQPAAQQETTTPATDTTDATEASESTDETASADETNATAEADEGTFVCETFEVEIPDGWSIDYDNGTSVKLVNAADPDSFDGSQDASLEINIGKFEYSDPNGSGSLEKIVESDKQFFVDGAPDIEDYTADNGYTGKSLTGKSFTHNTCNLVYLDLEYWKDGTNDRSMMKVREAYYNGEQLSAINAILNTLNITVLDTVSADTGDTTGTESAGAGEVAEFDGVKITVPSGWKIDDENSTSLYVRLVNPDKFSSGYVKVGNTFKSSDAATKAEQTNENFGGEGEVWTREYNGVTYYGVTVGTQEYAYTEASNDYLVEISTMTMTLDQVPEILEAVEVQ